MTFPGIRRRTGVIPGKINYTDVVYIDYGPNKTIRTYIVVAFLDTILWSFNEEIQYYVVH